MTHNYLIGPPNLASVDPGTFDAIPISQMLSRHQRPALGAIGDNADPIVGQKISSHALRCKARLHTMSQMESEPARRTRLQPARPQVDPSAKDRRRRDR
jgi:hypothetical protein